MLIRLVEKRKVFERYGVLFMLFRFFIVMKVCDNYIYVVMIGKVYVDLLVIE